MRRIKEIKTRYRAVVAEYGLIAVAFHMTVFTSLLVGGACAVGGHVEAQSVAMGNLGAIGGGYALTQITSPFRFLLTILVTPLLARLIRRWRTQA